MMSVRAHMPAYGCLHGFRNASVRTGIYVGVFLSAVLSAWVIVANRVPLFDRFAFLRNLAAVAVLGLIAVIPVFRFWRMPGNLLASSLVGWLLCCLTYRVLCMSFSRLEDRISSVHIFVVGALVYLLMATLSWIGIIIRRARRPNESRPHHHAS
ncbi:MAG TPA: hypothetical protein VE077_14950 [Candidatus Methylomirabilis sp.]|nr:hypothetical protein [Candidatus Methylomirabilis sp.]